MISILFGLGSAVSWGVADFSGGLASRQSGPYRAVFYAEIAGLILILCLIVFLSPPGPSWNIWALGLAAGVAGTG